MNYHFFLFTLIISISLAACNFPTLPNQKKAETPFFDLKSFFEEEARYLKAQNMSIKKTIRHNDTTEEHIIKVENWNDELRLFSESDINKPSWKNKYTLDSTDIGNGLVLLHYKATDKGLSTQVLDVKLADANVHSIVIINKTSNQVYEAQQYLTYIPHKSYTIEKIQDVTLFDKDEYNIKAKYIQK
jgi:hypothetical protein